MRSFINDLIQHTSAAQLARALYSTFVELRDTEDCFVDCHEMGLDPRNTTYPVIDHLVLISEAQSASEYTEIEYQHLNDM